MRFTPQAIKALSLPPGKSEHWEWDPGLPCFGVRVRPGLKRYYVQYRWNGKSEKQSLGDPATVSLPQAREAARSILARVQLGEDPQPAKRAPQAPPALSLSSIAQQYLARSAKPRLRPRSFEEVERHLTRLWAPLGNMELDRLGLQHVAARLGEIATENGPVAANRARASLSALFGWQCGRVSPPATLSSSATRQPMSGHAIASLLTRSW